MNENKFEKYYKRIINEEEWVQFVEILKKPLPFTFRINSFDFELSNFLKERLSLYIQSQRDQFNSLSIDPPYPINWYPGGMAWKHNHSVGKLEKLMPEYISTIDKLTQSRVIYRQEEVSMIPVLLLNVKAHHSVLDMCASPGSKTNQIIQIMSKTQKNIEGFIIANDSNYKRCFMLAETKHPSLIVTNFEGQEFPTHLKHPEKTEEVPLLFDRILCDVPCSGDGTLRKLPRHKMNSWDNTDALKLHPIQLSILLKGIKLLKPSGYLVYSTCSMNPIENEAVVASVLNFYPKSIKLVKPNGEVLKNLICREGLSNWSVMDEQGNILNKITQDNNNISKTMFPPDNIKFCKINRCVRVYPHLQNSGGFFIAIFKKVMDIDTKEEQIDQISVSNTHKITKRQIKKRFAESTMLTPLPDNIYKALELISKEDDISYQLFSRKNDEGQKKIIYCSKSLSDLLHSFGKNFCHSIGKQLRVVSIGQCMFEKQKALDQYKPDPGLFLNASKVHNHMINIELNVESIKKLLISKKITYKKVDYPYLIVTCKSLPGVQILCRTLFNNIILCGSDEELHCIQFLVDTLNIGR